MEGNDEKDKTVESTSTNVLANEKEKDENDNVDVVRKLSVSSALSHESVCNVDVERKLSVSSALSQESGCNVDVDRKLSVSSALSHESVCNAFSRAADTSDMRLIVDGKPLYVSRLVLSIISPVFKDIFEKRARELSIFEIPLPGRKYEEMLEFLYCVYPDSLKPISDENLAVLLRLSDEFKVHTLRNRCSQFMLRQVEGSHKSVKIEKVVWFIKLAEHYRLDDVHEKAMELATRTPSELLENNSEFYDLSPTTTTQILMGRLRLFEKASQKIQKKLSETETHCSLYHEREGICTKCYVSIGKLAAVEFTKL